MSISFLVIKAYLIRDVCTFSSMDPYFIASISNTKQFKSQKKKNEGKYPLWNEGSIFNYSQGETEIKFELFHDKINIGAAKLDFSKLESELLQDFELPLIKETEFNGKLLVKVKIYADGTNSKKVTSSFLSNFNKINDNNLKKNSKEQLFQEYKEGNSNEINYSGKQGSELMKKFEKKTTNTSKYNMSYYDLKNKLSDEFLNHYDSIYTATNNQGVDQGYKIYQDNDDIQLHKFNKNILNTDWWKSLTYFKNPLFMLNNSNSLFCFDFKERRWEILVNFTEEFFPKNYRLT